MIDVAFLCRAVQGLAGRGFCEYLCFYAEVWSSFLSEPFAVLYLEAVVFHGSWSSCCEEKCSSRESFQDMTEEDVESELAVIHSQMAYVMQLQGRTEEALQLYNQVIKLK